MSNAIIRTNYSKDNTAELTELVGDGVVRIIMSSVALRYHLRVK